MRSSRAVTEYRKPADGGSSAPARSFLVLLVSPQMRFSDVRWIEPETDPDAEADLDRLLERDGARRRWLGAGVAGPGSQG